MRFTTMLNDEIKSEFDELGKMEVGSESYKAAIDGLAKLMDRAIEVEKLEAEADDKTQSRELDYEFKSKQAKVESIDRWVKNTISVAGIIVPVVVTIWGVQKSFEFEKEGTITTIVGRGFIQKLLPKK